MHLELCLGNWNASVGICSPDLEEILGKAMGVFKNVYNGNCGDNQDNEAYVAICTSAILTKPEIPSWLPVREKDNWYAFLNALQDVSLRIKRGVPDGFPIYYWPPLRSGRGANIKNKHVYPVDNKRFFAFVMDQSDEHCRIELMLYILFLATEWHVVHGGLSVHASAVANNDKGFLFLGQSEAGKTTVTRLSSSVGHIPLGDDLNFIIKTGGDDYILAAGPTLSNPDLKHSSQRPVLRGIFHLVQDARDYLVPLPPIKVAQKVVESLGQIPFYADLSDENINKAFHAGCAIARSVPGYELHFRKSSDFWAVIDEQFSK